MTIGVEGSARRHGTTGEMIFERKVGLQIVEGQIERRDASK
jgi:hypothetical protein